MELIVGKDISKVYQTGEVSVKALKRMTFSIGERSFKVVALLDVKEGSQIASTNIYLSLAEAQILFSRETKGVNVVYSHLKTPSLLGPVKTRISKELSGVSVTSSDSFLELMGESPRSQINFPCSSPWPPWQVATLLIIKTILSNLVARSGEIGILKAVGWREKDVQKQLMGDVLLQALLGGILGVMAGYGISYLLGFLSIPVSTPWEVNLMPAFAKDPEAASHLIQPPVSVSAGLVSASFVLSLLAGGLASWFMGRRTTRMKPADILRRLRRSVS